MKTQLFTLALALGLAAADDVLLCQTYSYADGHVYCRMDSSTNSCLADLGNFPTKTSFQLDLQASPNGIELGNLQAAQPTSIGTYHLLDRLMYIDASPGAFSPVSFTNGPNTTLTGGQTTYGFFSAYGIMIWAPGGDTSKLGPPDGSGGEEVIASSGWALVDVAGYSGLKMLYWNQTQYEEMLKGVYPSTSGYLYCYADYDPTFV